MPNEISSSGLAYGTGKGNVLDTRRVGEYGHYVMPLQQLLDDLSIFLDGIDLNAFRPETLCIERAEQGVHPEEAAILYALARACRPELVLETGTFRGYSTAEVARALQANAFGHIHTVDLDPNSGTNVPVELRSRVTFHRGNSSRAFLPYLQQRKARIDLFFHDSLHTYMNALGELIWFAPFLKSNSVIVCHDAKMDFMPDFGVGRAVREFAGELRLPYRILDTTCGLAVIRWTGNTADADLERLRSIYVAHERRNRSLDLARRAFRGWRRLFAAK